MFKSRFQTAIGELWRRLAHLQRQRKRTKREKREKSND